MSFWYTGEGGQAKGRQVGAAWPGRRPGCRCRRCCSCLLLQLRACVPAHPTSCPPTPPHLPPRHQSPPPMQLPRTRTRRLPAATWPCATAGSWARLCACAGSSRGRAGSGSTCTRGCTRSAGSSTCPARTGPACAGGGGGAGLGWAGGAGLGPWRRGDGGDWGVGRGQGGGGGRSFVRRERGRRAPGWGGGPAPRVRSAGSELPAAAPSETELRAAVCTLLLGCRALEASCLLDASCRAAVDAAGLPLHCPPKGWRPWTVPALRHPRRPASPAGS
jgi:hypothetical protein